jgi:Cu(I)/Ag(I) efflux system membrane fusion protein
VRRQLIGVKTAVVTRQPMYRTIRAYGRVGADETRMSDISLKYDVWIGELKADFVGAKVNKGDVLFTIFSPDLYAAQQEYLQITKRSKASSAALLDAARKRLTIWGMTSDQIRSLEAKGAAREYVPILSELDGYVVSKTIVEGTGAPAGSSLMRIADLSSLWVEADIYEADFSLIKLGTPATITLSYSQKTTLEGRVDYVYPIMQHDTRTGRVRFSFPNPDGTLRPGMYAEANFRVHLGQHFAVPEEAVLVAGNKRIVFTDIGQGRLAPQYVTTGRQADGLVEILSGLDEGDRIVTSGNFLIASESKLRAGIKQW